MSYAGAFWHLRKRWWVIDQCGQSCYLHRGNRHYSPSTVCGRLNPTCHHWEVVKLNKGKAGQGGSSGPLTVRTLSLVGFNCSRQSLT